MNWLRPEVHQDPYLQDFIIRYLQGELVCRLGYYYVETICRNVNFATIVQTIEHRNELSQDELKDRVFRAIKNSILEDGDKFLDRDNHTKIAIVANTFFEISDGNRPRWNLITDCKIINGRFIKGLMNIENQNVPLETKQRAKILLETIPNQTLKKHYEALKKPDVAPGDRILCKMVL